MTQLDSFHAPMAFPARLSTRDQSIPLQGFQHAVRAAAHSGDHAYGTAYSPADLEYDIDDGNLRIRIDGPLDLRCAFALLLIGQTVDDSIDACTLDLTGVDRIFDSGIAALVLVARELKRKGVARIRIHGLDLDSPTLRPFLI